MIRDSEPCPLLCWLIAESHDEQTLSEITEDNENY